MAIVCGIEEAGRGPVIGPMVMAGVCIDEKDEDELARIGVKDSKLLTPRQREGLFERIKRIAKRHHIIVLQPAEIDAALRSPSTNLNWLEADTSTALLNRLAPDRAILDCPSPNTEAYVARVRQGLEKDMTIRAEHKADLLYPVVSAASIIAKVVRDREIEDIKRRHNVQFGSGYPADPLTQRFLERNHDKYPFFRKTWKSYVRVAQRKAQKGISDF
ncbi:ribonuclease HII [Candidatus Woesearchaeota archaeon]|nr:ribonuclease HII [Candidatus Woesearchaeota archaeon]